MEIKFLCSGSCTLPRSIRFSKISAGGKTAGPQPSAVWGAISLQTGGLELYLLPRHSKTPALGFWVINHIHREDNSGYCNLFENFIQLFFFCVNVENARVSIWRSEKNFWRLRFSPHHIGSRDRTWVIRLGCRAHYLPNPFTGPRCCYFEGGKKKLFKLFFK